MEAPKTVKKYWEKKNKKMKQFLGGRIFGKDYPPSGFKVLRIKEVRSEI